MKTSQKTCSCGAPMTGYCHECHRPVCAKCFRGFLVAHCPECWRKHESPKAADLFSSVPQAPNVDSDKE